MKKTVIKILAAALLIASAMSLAACGKGDIYQNLSADGYTVKVRFDSGAEKKLMATFAKLKEI